MAENLLEFKAPDGRVLKFSEPPPPEAIDGIFEEDLRSRIAETAEKHGVPLDVAMGVARTESNFRHVGPDGKVIKNPKSSARGIYQLVDAARKDVFGDTKVHSLDEEIDGGLRYLRMMADRHEGDWEAAVGAYYAGAAGLKQRGMDDPEVKEYLTRVFGPEGRKKQLELTGGEVGLETRSQEEVEQAEALGAHEQHYGLPKRIGHGALTTLGAAGGAFAGLAAGGGPLSPASAVTVPAGTAVGYGLGESISQGLGFAPGTGVVEQLGDAAQVGVGTAGAMRGGPLGFAAANQTAAAAMAELKKRMGLPYDEEATLAGLAGPGDYIATGAAGGKALERFSFDALLDMASLGIAAGGTRLSGRNEAKKQAEKAMKATEVFAAEEAVPESQEFLRKADRIRQAAAEKAGGVPAIAQKEIRRELEDDVANKAYQNLLGPHAQTKIAIDPGDQGNITLAQSAQREKVADAYFKPKSRVQKLLGDEYEALSGELKQVDVDVSDLRERVGAYIGELKEAGRWNRLSTATREQLNDLAKLGKAQDVDASQLLPGFENANPAEQAKLLEIAKQAGLIKEAKPVKFQELLDQRSKASSLVANSASANDQAVAHEVTDMLLEELGKNGLDTPAFKQLNRRYADYFKLFRPTTRKVARGFDVEDWGKYVFGDPEVALRVFDAANATEKSTLREALATYALSKGDKLEKTLKEIGEPTLKRYFGDTALSKSRVWLDFDKDIDKFGAMLSQSPQAQARYAQAVQKELTTIANEEGKQLVDQALSFAKKLDQGVEFNAKLYQAGSPQEQAKVAMEFIDSIDPVKISEAYRSGDLGVKHAAKILSKVNVADYTNAAKKRAAYGGLLGVVQTWTVGSPGGLAITAMLYGAIGAGPSALKARYIESLRDPRAAEAFIRAVKKGEIGGVGQAVAKAIAASLAVNARKPSEKTEENQPTAAPLEAPTAPQATPTPLRF